MIAPKASATAKTGADYHTRPDSQTKNKVGMTDELRQVADLITANINSTTKAVLTADEAARYMGISKSTLYKMTMRKQIPHSKPNGKVCYFDRLELEAWLMSNRVATADELQDRAQAYCAHTRTSNKKGGRP